MYLNDWKSQQEMVMEDTPRAAVAKQLCNGVRLYIDAHKTLESMARPVPDAKMIEVSPHA